MTVELFANPSVPGVLSPVTTLAAAITSTSATTINVLAAAPAPLQATGQYRILIDAEIMLVTGGANTTSWTVVRGASAETGSVAATHLNGANVYHTVTAAALRTFAQTANNLSDLASASSARTNLGLGTAAVQNVAAFAQTANNLSDVTAATARTNLGLGTAATQASTAFDAAGLSAAETTRAQAAEALLAPLSSPALINTPTAPTKAALTNSTAIATTAYADAAVSVERIRATAAEALLAPLASPALTGSPTAPTLAGSDNSTKLATTAQVQAAISASVAGVASFNTRTGAVVPVSGDYTVGLVTGAAPLANPTFTGVPAAPTAAGGTNSTQLATTAFVTAAVAGVAVPALGGSTQAGPTYTLVLADVNTIIWALGTLAISIPKSVTNGGTVAWVKGTTIYIFQDFSAASGVNVAGVTGVTVVSSGGLTHTAQQYSLIALTCIAAAVPDVWLITGDRA